MLIKKEHMSCVHCLIILPMICYSILLAYSKEGLHEKNL